MDHPQPEEKALPGKLTKASIQYGDLTVIRAIIQAIPTVGGSLDTLLAAGGQKWKAERAEHFFSELNQQVRALAAPPKLKDVATSEELHDLVHYSLEQVVKTRSSGKRRRFANIISRQLAEPVTWDEPEAAARLLSELSELDVHLLSVAATAPACGPPFDGLRVTELEQDPPVVDDISRDTFKPVDICKAIPSATRAALRMSCAGLMARGLLKDEGVGRYGGVAMRFFVPTESASWFLGWIKE
jgi:hypothetical protein